MCLAIPGKVIEIIEENDLLMGKIDYDGIVNKVCLVYVPEIKVGQYAIVHAGFAITVINEDDAMKTLEIWEEMRSASAEEGCGIWGNSLSDSDEET